MLQELYSKSKSTKFVPISSKYQVLKDKQIQENGRLVRKSEFVVVDVVEENRSLTIHDFSLENINALGNPALMQPVTMRKVDYDALIEKAAMFNQKLDQNELAEQTTPVAEEK